LKEEGRRPAGKGLLIVNTGTGKGKSSAAFGMGMRILGHGMKLGVVQFIKGALYSAERDFLGSHANATSTSSAPAIPGIPRTAKPTCAPPRAAGPRRCA
jgi:ATP:corrinoid adenosyltransferase